MCDLMRNAPLNNTLQELPEEVTTLSGVKFQPRLEKWFYRDSTKNITLNFNNISAEFKLIISAKKVLIWYAENKSPDHLNNMFRRIQHFLNFSNANNKLLSIITGDDL
ncbi:MAG TPA: hypothetical protein PLG02_08110, partial [Methylotenera sp.]|nr:hypothetical protein [Methylotenera sp.]